MKPVKQTPRQAANTAESQRPLQSDLWWGDPHLPGKRTPGTYIGHDKEAPGPISGLDGGRPPGPCLHRCTTKPQGIEDEGSESGSAAADCI